MTFTITLTQIVTPILTLIVLAGWGLAYRYFKLLDFKDLEAKESIRKLIQSQSTDKQMMHDSLQKDLATAVEAYTKELNTIQSQHETELTEIADLAEVKFKALEAELGSAVELYEKYITNIDALIQISHNKIREVDNKGMFKTDDEIQFFFEALKDIQSELDKFRIEMSVAEN